MQACESLASVAQNRLPRLTLASYLRSFSPPRAAVRIHPQNNSADSHPLTARRRTMAARGWSPQAPPSPSRSSRTLHLVELVLATRTAERADRVGPSAQSAGVTARGSRRVSRAHRPPLDARPEPTAVRLFPNNGPAPWHAGPPGPAGGSCRHPPWKPHPVASVGRQTQGGCLRRRRWAHLRSVRTPTLPPHAFHTGRSTI